MRRLSYLAVMTLLCLPTAHATEMWTFETPSGASDTDGALDASVVFTIDGTTLYISLTNDEANPTAAGQLLSDLSFVLSGGLTAGTLSQNISSTVGTSTPVTLLDSSFNATTTTTNPVGSKPPAPSWQFSYGSADCGGGASNCYFLNDLTGGQPQNMIIGPGPYTNANASIGNFAPSLAGTVVFEVDGVTNLSDSTTVSSVNLSFGTGPDFFAALCADSDTNCLGGGAGGQSVTPEPLTIGLTASGLGALLLLRRRRAA